MTNLSAELQISKLEVLRRQRGLSGSDLMRNVGYRPAIFSQIERRQRTAWPRFQLKVAQALGVLPGELFDERGFVREIRMKLVN